MLKGFADISEVLGAGIYVLLAQGRVVFVGKSSRVMLTKIANHRAGDRPKWFPLANIQFDSVKVKFVHPDLVEAVYQGLIAEYQPRYNTTPRAIPTSVMERRI